MKRKPNSKAPSKRGPRLAGHTYDDNAKLLAADSLGEYARDHYSRPLRIGDAVWMRSVGCHALIVAIVFNKVIGVSTQYIVDEYQIGDVLMEDDAECFRSSDAANIHERAYALHNTRPTVPKKKP